MDLDPQIAETIVTNLKGIINHEISLFDTAGTIIASTDRRRIGTSHDGARLAIRTKQTISTDDDHEYKGSKRGINVPVVFNDSVVAVVGITGRREEVEPFGNVIKKMTEILIRENWEQIARFDQRERLTSLVDQLKLRHHDPSLANYLASILEIDLTLPRRCVVGRLVAGDGAACKTGEGATSESPYATVYARLQQLGSSFFSISGEDICMFVAEGDSRDLQKLLRGLQHDCEERLHLSLVCGIGDVATSPETYWRSYDEAYKAADCCSRARAHSRATTSSTTASSSPRCRPRTPNASSVTSSPGSPTWRLTSSRPSSTPTRATTAASSTAPTSSSCTRTRCRTASTRLRG